MNEREASDLLSAYLDGELTAAERSSMDGHLRLCGECRAELESLSRVKALTHAAPRKAMPADMVARLERRVRGESWWSRLMPAPRLRWAGAAALAGLCAAALWHARAAREEETLPLEALLAAHSRSTAENLVPTDLVASNFSAQLAAYYEAD
ncbi:MAG TPA: zf-HC2 domain-containing protein [Elusimicrobiota bacterium]|jgi:anti-sigma factor RsiW|nr:zf-HC2 domain-containing protein [Elusimicrobiota bacterium]